MIRVQLEVAALTPEHRLRGPVACRHMPALMAGLAGVPGVHGHQLPTLVLQALGQLAPVAGQDPAVQAGLGLDVGAGTVLGPLSGLRHAAGVQLLDHQGVGLVRQRPTDVVGVIAADPLLLAPQFLQLPPQPPRPYRAPLLARLLALIPRGPGGQAGHFRQRVRPARTVGDLPHIPVQTQYSRGCAGAYGDCGHCIGEIDVPLGPRARAFLPDAGLPRLPVGIGVTALEPQPAEAGHVQVLVLHPDALRDGEPVLPAVPALEAGIRPRALKEGLVGIRQVFQDIADLAAAVLLQPRVPGVPPQGCELLAQAEEGHLGALLPRPLPVCRVLLLRAGQKVIPHKPTSSRRTGQLVGYLAVLRQQTHPHTAVDGLSLCYSGRSRHGIHSSLSGRER